MKCVRCGSEWNPETQHPKCDEKQIVMSVGEMNWANALLQQKQERIAELDGRLDVGN